MSLQIHNTLSRKLEIFKPLRQDEVKVYYCGPTPYNYAHIGNLRAYLFEDFVIRTLRFLGYRVKTVMNITDIDDKTIRDSQKSNKTLLEFTEFYSEAFLEDIDKLSIARADTIAPISTLIPEMWKLIQWLLDKGFAYLAEDGSIYYRVEKFKAYGELAHLDMSGMKSSVRINNDEYEKDQVADFALWKAYDETSDGPNFWEIEININPLEIMRAENEESEGDKLSESDENGKKKGEANEFLSPSGAFDTFQSWKVEKIKLKWRPGWHIECSACNYKFFGEQIDIHMGGIDNLFPHHQNEVAQTEAFTGKQFSKYWMHGWHLLVDNKKMAKSAGNFYTLRDIVDSPLIKGVGGISDSLIYRGFRLMALQNQYRENFNFTFDRLTAAINTIKWLDEMIKRIGRYIKNQPEGNMLRNAHGKMKFHEISREFRDNQQAFMQDFIEKLENDFDTNLAMTTVFELQTYVNSGIDEELFSLEEAKSILDILRSWNEVIAILDFSLLEEEEIPEEITKLALARLDAKVAKDWAQADTIRDKLAEMGWKMIDEAGGKWRVEKI
jgi:cysteinyl-tRNA synthetase